MPVGAVSTYLTSSTDDNPWVRDINIAGVSEKTTCYAESGSALLGMRIALNGTCFEHVHYQLYNVYDFSAHAVQACLALPCLGLACPAWPHA